MVADINLPLHVQHVRILALISGSQLNLQLYFKKKQKNDGQEVAAFLASFMRQIYNHIPPLPLAGKYCFSAPPYACHLVPSIPDGPNAVQLCEQLS